MKTVKRLLIVSLVAWMLVAAVPGQAAGHRLTPVVFFPGWFESILEVKVDGQTAFLECPSSGTFEWVVGNPNPTEEFSQVCQDELLTLVIDPHRGKPVAERISNQRGVKVAIKDYGQTQSAPHYEPLYAFLEQAGYERNVDIRVAGWDSRLTPDLGGFMKRTKALIEETYRQNGKTPVHLVGHSNGPLYAQYLLTHTSQSWKTKYIHGFTPIAGNWPGQGGGYGIFFMGFNFNLPEPIPPFDNVASSAAMFQSWPTTYMSAADPAVFKKQEVVIGVAGGRQYTPQDYQQLFQDADMPLARELADYYLGFVQFATPKYYPNVDVYAEKGSGLPTVVGLELHELKVAPIYVNFADVVLRDDGDGNQEDITNDAIVDVWKDMRCYRFEFHDNPGVDHGALPSNPDVLQRLLTHLQQPRSVCRGK